MEKELLKERYKEQVDALVKYGKFKIISSTVKPKSIRKLDPTASTLAQRNTFLGDKKKKVQRQELKNWLQNWHALLSGSNDIEELKNKANEEAEKTTSLINKNVKVALDETRKLEQSYRSIQAFFKNSGTDKLRNLTILNASIDQLANPDFDIFRNEVKNELTWSYGTLGKSENYSLVVVPGCMGDSTVLREWAKIARENKVLLLTDFEDLEDYETVLTDFEEEGYADLEHTNVVMSCNWLIARQAEASVGEEEDVAIPPSSALAGKMYDPNVPIAQPRAGKRYGTLDNIRGVRFKLLQEHIGELDQLGLVPMTNDFKVVMPYSARTLSSADDVGLRTYSVVRVYDWVGKVIMDFLNQAGFENASQKMLDTYRNQIAKFLNSIKGPNKLIKDFAIKKFQTDEENGQPDRILVHVVMDPLFPAKSFALKMDGTKGDGIDNYDWNTTIDAE